MNDNFPVSLAYVLQNEGGFVNDPADAGGATNFGITTGTLTAWRNATDITHDVKHLADDKDVEGLTREEAGEIYRAWYWEIPDYGKICSPAIATALFDVSVLFGIGAAVLCAQRALGKCGLEDEIVVDGRIGSKTIHALNAVDDNIFLKAFHLILTLRIGEIITKRPLNEKFRQGWERRVDRLLSLTTRGIV